MYARFKERFGTAGVVLGVIALILALGGTALAAKGALTGKQKKEVEKIAKKYAGKPGAPGGPGTNGTNGTNGKDGAPGANGTNGEDGTNGKSVTVTTAKPTECNALGGVIVKETGAASGSEVCNGEVGPEGPEGPEGALGTAGTTLPPGATETGTWAFNASDANETIFAPISFTIPLSEGLEETHVHFQSEATFSNFCHGFPTEPSAPPGELCVYYTPSGGGLGLKNAVFEGIGNPASQFTFATGPSGAIIRFGFIGEPGDGAFGFGSWAVTGCSASLPDGDPNKCPA